MRSRTTVTPITSLGDGATRSFGMLSSFPPTACGIATFSAALAAGLVANGAGVDVVRCGDGPELEDPLVVASFGNTASGRDEAIDALNRTDVAIVQHEYGIYDGDDGDAVVPLLGRLVVPTVVVAHTVVRNPTQHQRSVLEQVCDAADAVAVMTMSARDRLVAGFDVEPSKVNVIAHGATTPVGTSSRSVRSSVRPKRLLSWGLLGPGKGIEWAIDAVASLSDLRPHPTYVIAGSTHPKVLARSGEEYREMLVTRTRRAGVVPYVSFDDAYRGLADLTELIRSADVVVLPYDSVDQVTSGVLVDAVAAGRPVIATAFPHAVELLGSGAGIVVPQRDPDALAAAMRRVLTDDALYGAMAAEARRLAPDLSWSAIAGRYDQLADRLIASRNVLSA